MVARHSYGGNVAIKVAAGGGFADRLVLLSPSFSREDEFRELAILDRAGRVPGLGRLAWTAAVKAMPRAMRDNDAERRRLEACPSVRMATLAEAGHMMLTEQPERTAEVILADASGRR